MAKSPQSYPKSASEIAQNREKMRQLEARCTGGRVRPIIVPMGVRDLLEAPGAVQAAKEPLPGRPRLISEQQARAWHAEYMRPGETLKSVACRHGVGYATLASRFHSLRLKVKNKGHRAVN